MSTRLFSDRHRSREGGILLGGFFLLVFLITYIWWPLAKEYLAYIDWHGPWWLFLDWLLIGVFAFMSITLVIGANLRHDSLVVFVGLIGGLMIEAWGTQTNLWSYYTAERPPLWIVPAWPISALSIDRMTRFLQFISQREIKWNNHTLMINLQLKVYRLLYWLIMIGFLALMLSFVSPTLAKPYTSFALLVCLYLVVTPTDHRLAVLNFISGTSLGYFLELWGTTSECWTYYTLQTPPLFAVFAHGLAAVAFWRALLLMKFVAAKFAGFRLRMTTELGD